MAYRIQLSVKADANVLALSGEMDSEVIKRLKGLLGIQRHSRLILDLNDITHVSREALEFLAWVEAAGVGIMNCPDHVRAWITAEKPGNQPMLTDIDVGSIQHVDYEAGDR